MSVPASRSTSIAINILNFYISIPTFVQILGSFQLRDLDLERSGGPVELEDDASDVF